VRKKLLLLLAMLLLVIVASMAGGSSVVAESFKVHVSLKVDGASYLGCANGSENTFKAMDWNDAVNDYIELCLVLYDEEWENIIYKIGWGQSVGWQGAIDNIMGRSNNAWHSQLKVYWKVVDYVKWESPANASSEEMLQSAVASVGFVPFGDFRWNGQKVHWIMAFTGQGLGDAVGISVDEWGIVMVTHYYYPWDDNVLHHEQSHLFGTDDHDDPSDSLYYTSCCLSYRVVEVFLGVWEDGAFWWANYARVAYVSYDFCEGCWGTIVANLPIHGTVTRWMVPFGGEVFAV